MIVIVGRYSINSLLRTDSILVIGIGNVVRSVCSCCKLSSVPRHCVAAVGGRVAACIIANFFSVVGRQLIRPALVLGCTTAKLF